MVFCTAFAMILCNSIVLDSSFLTLDIANARVAVIELQEQIIDHVFDDHLFVCTTKNLYKIAPSGTLLIDKTPLPMRFNHMMLKGNDIVLIATDEVIVLDRNNLTFKSGIGLERGDHRPIVKNQSFAVLPTRDYIYLASDAGEQSIIRIIDQHSGRLLRKVTTARVKSFEYDAKNQSFIALDIKNNILIFDLYMNRKRKIQLKVLGHTVAIHPDGFLIRSDQGIQLINAQGKIIDFQPIPNSTEEVRFLVLSRGAIVVFDKTTLRPCGWQVNHEKIVQLYPCTSSNHEIGINPLHNLYLVQKEPFGIIPLMKHRSQLKWAGPSLASADSLWYLQLGAFSDPVNAQLAYERIRLTGLPALVDSTDMYRIKLGGFLDKLTGLHIAQELDLSGWFVYETRSRVVNHDTFYVGNEKYLIKEGIIRKELP